MSAAAATADAPAQAGGGKKKLILIAAPALVAALLAGLWFGGILPPLLGMGGKEEGKAAHGEAKSGHGEAKPAHGETKEGKEAKGPLFLEMPEIVANLNAGPRRTSYVKMKPRLELARPEDEAVVKAAMPRLLDLFQTYLREMRPEELRGSAGTYRLREELLARANIAVAPARVVDVLFADMLVQ